ncbi:SDR family NAD(P)-dependent oxidoreductase [Rhodococcus tibetensis]|uniref:SDR family NAD(P)-dependent oxidoreductase n=1 Tax=Rhodococcus tibetensis TaxID=2965064 RepID=A0ABT1QJM9_9NOCA|nr:SDR family NAD(P)-dependent oxidoreductase [Rhodococcus sp. FXJ9.536]MCQ4122494.1 SDR family NAD(P)-dependent oxidoreductase [Rhodococcus sp. FXJ9.536]
MHASALNAVVTGSDSGIGRAVALALADDGFHLGLAYAADRDSAEATALEVRSMSVRAVVRKMDLAELPHSATAVDEFARELGGIGVLISCPGSTAVECMQRGVRYMIAGGQGGRIVNITASVSALGALTGLLANELSRYSVTVNSIVVPAADSACSSPCHDDGEAAAVASYLTAPAAMFVTGAEYKVEGRRVTMTPHSLADPGSRRPDPRGNRRIRSYAGRWAPTRWTR